MLILLLVMTTPALQYISCISVSIAFSSDPFGFMQTQLHWDRNCFALRGVLLLPVPPFIPTCEDGTSERWRQSTVWTEQFKTNLQIFSHWWAFMLKPCTVLRCFSTFSVDSTLADQECEQQLSGLTASLAFDEAHLLFLLLTLLTTPTRLDLICWCYSITPSCAGCIYQHISFPACKYMQHICRLTATMVSVPTQNSQPSQLPSHHH